MAKILGIDLGTTFSAMAVVEAGEPKILENKEGARTTPSVVALGKNGERLAGILAKRQQTTNPKNTIFSIKRLIGRRFLDPEVQQDKKLLPYELKESSDHGIEVKMGDKWFKPLEISAMLLQKLKRDAEEKLGEEIQEAIITCPAYFDDSQRKATKVAGEVAGFKVRRVINEPTAAALAYGLTKKGEKKIVVYDFGGGTFDVSILDVGEDTVEVISTGGDAHLGGEDFDQKVLVWLVDRFKQEQGIDLSKDQLALQRLKEAAEKAKIELSSTMQTEINLPFITATESGPKHLTMTLTRAKFEQLIDDLLQRTIPPCEQALKDAGLTPKDIDEVRLLNDKAFGQPVEGHIVDKLRQSCNRILSLVAISNNKIVGHIMFSPVTIETQEVVIQGMGLAPMAVLPELQNQGIGSILVKEGLRIIRNMSYPFVIVLGHKKYYPRFGFERASKYGLKSQWEGIPDEAFMAMILNDSIME